MKYTIPKASDPVKRKPCPKTTPATAHKPRRAYSMPPLMVKPIRRFHSFQAASKFVDLRLQQKPPFCFNIQQSAFDTWIVSRVISGGTP